MYSTVRSCTRGKLHMNKLLLLACFATLSYAQSDSASLSGAVTDSGAASIVGAKITLRNTATHNQRTALSDDQGLYRFSLLIPGTYEITIDSPGMKQFHNADLVLNVAQAGPPGRADGSRQQHGNRGSTLRRSYCSTRKQRHRER